MNDLLEERHHWRRVCGVILRRGDKNLLLGFEKSG
jgi:hypothetical protein